MKKKISEIILEKDFTIAQFGWKAEEVDNFLDKISGMISELENELVALKRDYEVLENKNEVLERKLTRLELENTKLKGHHSTEMINPDNYNNVKMLERISRLEETIQDLVKSLKDKNL